MSECVEIQQKLHIFVDEESDEKEALFIEEHLSDCSLCQTQVERLYTLKERLQETMSQKAPASLQDRIQTSLSPAPARQKRRLFLAGLLPLAAALGLGGVVLSTTGFFSRVKQPQKTSEVFELSVDRHRRNLPIEIPGPNSEQVQLWFQGKMPFPVHVPSLGNNTHLLGGRISAMQEELAVQLFYERRGNKITVLAFDPRQVPFTPQQKSPKVRIENRDVYVSTLEGHKVILFQDQGVGYSIIADVDDEELSDIVATGWPR